MFKNLILSTLMLFSVSSTFVHAGHFSCTNGGIKLDKFVHNHPKLGEYLIAEELIEAGVISSILEANIGEDGFLYCGFTIYAQTENGDLVKGFDEDKKDIVLKSTSSNLKALREGILQLRSIALELSQDKNSPYFGQSIDSIVNNARKEKKD